VWEFEVVALGLFSITNFGISHQVS